MKSVHDTAFGKLNLNTAATLKLGHLLSRTGKRDYTILLVGETGVGKTTLLSCIKNALLGKSPINYDLNVHDLSNESGLGSGTSQTNDAKLYVFTNMNGVVLRVLDTPGLADTRGVQLDEMHKMQIAQSIRDVIETLDVVLIMANGTNPRLGQATNYALTTLSSMFPVSLANNIGVLFTNVPDSLSWNFEIESLPSTLRHAEYFTFNNPVALERRRREKPGRTQDEQRKNLRKVATTHHESLDTLAGLFDWIDHLTPQPTNDIITLYEYTLEIERTMLNTQSQIVQAMNARKELAKFQDDLTKVEIKLDDFRNYERIIHRSTFELVQVERPATICHQAGCYCNCHESCGLQATGFWWWVNKQRCYDCWGHTLNFWFYPACKKCHHERSAHSHSNFIWRPKEHTFIAVDEAVRELFYEATTEKERKEHIGMEIKRNIVNFSRSIEFSMATLAGLAKAYSSISLSGNYSSHLEEGIKLSRQILKTMRANGDEKDVVDSVESHLVALEKNLNLLKEAQRKHRAKNTVGGGILDLLLQARDQVQASMVDNDMEGRQGRWLLTG